jgi:hypothetical protein
MTLALTITDNGDGTGGVATLSGTGGVSTTVWAALWTGVMGATPAFTSVGTRVGDGTINLTQQGFYVWVALNTSSLPYVMSNSVFQSLTAAAPAEAWEDTLADAVVTELNSALRPWNAVFVAEGTTAVRTRAPWYVAADLAKLKVAVVPLTIERKRISRGARETDYGVAIDLQRMIEPTDDTNLKKFSVLAEQIHNYFDDGHLLTGVTGNWGYLKADRRDVYGLSQLYAQRTWETLISLDIRGYRP